MLMWERFSQQFSKLKESKPIIIEISDVAHYLYEDDPKENWELNKGDFPNIIPSWPSSWWEWQVPKYTNSNGTIRKLGWDGLERVGAYVFAREYRPSPEKTLKGWGVFITTIVPHPHKKNTLLYWLSCAYKVDCDGRIPEPHDKNIMWAINNTLAQNVAMQGVSPGDLCTILFPLWLAMSFCHCKNVTIQKHHRDEPLIKARRKQGLPCVVYHTVDIVPVRKILEAASGNSNNGLKRRLHICRGHFAHYIERGLFGKYFGTFWHPMHTRGEVSIGSVEKDYHVSSQTRG